MLIAFVSGKGAPGTSTSALALALAWPRLVLLAECDPRGGDLVWGFGQGRDTAAAVCWGCKWRPVTSRWPPPYLSS